MGDSMSAPAVALLICPTVVFLVLWLKARKSAEISLKRIEIQEREIGEFKDKYLPIMSIEEELSRLRSSAEQARTETDAVRKQYADKRSILKKLEQQVAIYDERISFAELGIYEPHFEFGDSETYKTNIRQIRERQKEMVSSKEATFCPTGWTIDGSRSKGQTMINRQTRLTMRAFNNECEAAIANARWNNVVAMEKRILNAVKQIDSANASMNLVLNRNYIALKIDELGMTHEYRERLKIEKDERAELARAEREEKKLLAEAEASEREERKYAKLLEKARNHASVDENRIAELEATLAEAQAKSERARAMAEITRSGYVYIISNIGSFGDDMVKIGSTRRLDPDDRVRELGGASVPFRFDTHAMIYSEDAPALEAALHTEFTDHRVNAANMRKEFFRITLDKVEEAVRTLAPNAGFFRDREAQEWHETLALRREVLVDMQKASDEFPESI